MAQTLLDIPHLVTSILLALGGIFLYPPLNKWNKKRVEKKRRRQQLLDSLEETLQNLEEYMDEAHNKCARLDLQLQNVKQETFKLWCAIEEELSQAYPNPAPKEGDE